MEENTLSLRKNKEIQVLLVLFLIFSAWRIILYFTPVTEDFNPLSFAWGATYQFVAIWGAIRGFMIARAWGGWKSMLGKAILMFSIGLLLQSFGQTISSIFVFNMGEIPYPSLGDIGFFGSVIFYICGSYLLAKVSGVSVSLQNSSKQIFVILAFIAMIFISFWIFISGQQFDWSDTLSTLLNIGYPIGQAAYVAIVLLTLLLTQKYLGGLMKKPISFFLIALLAQYISDFTFLYQVTHELYVPEGLNDLMYFLSYFMMAVSLIFIGNAFNKIKES